MKKILTGLLSYTIIACLICLVIGMFAFPMPVLNPRDIFAYRWNNGLLFVMTILPSIVGTGLLLGGSIYFGKIPASPAKRFSPPIVDAFKIVIVLTVCLTFAITIVHEVFVPVAEQKKVAFEEKPGLINEYKTLAHVVSRAAGSHPDHALYTQLAQSLANWCALMEKTMQETDERSARSYAAVTMCTLCRELRLALKHPSGA